MGTRSNIGILNKDGSKEFVYCHWDGYPSNNGKLLLRFYNSEDAARGLIALGGMSSLRGSIIAEGPHSYDKPDPNVTVYYHRDRGEPWEDNKPMTVAHGDVNEHSWEEWVYLWDVSKGFWTFSRGRKILELKQLTIEAFHEE